MLKNSLLNSITLRKAKTVYSFGFPECNRVKKEIFLKVNHFFILLDLTSHGNIGKDKNG